MKYRSRVDIASAILEIAREGARRTEILYKAYLSYPQLREYLDTLTGSGMLRYAGDDEKTYYTTEKGRRLLDMYRELDNMIPRENMLTIIKE